MIICPNCKAEIDDDSHYCDQCGSELLYCERCGRVGQGRRCTQCGGLMLKPDDYQKKSSQAALSASISQGIMSQGMLSSTTDGAGLLPSARPLQGVPQLVLYNNSLGIRIVAVNGAVIGRRQGPYAQFFQQNMYVSGLHAQLKYKADTGWCIADKHSSNGTRLNNHLLQPDVEMSLKHDDIVTIANVNLQVSIS